MTKATVPALMAEALQRHSSIDHRPGARLYKKELRQGVEAAYLGHALVRNRNGLIAAAMAIQADGHAERDASC